MNILIIGGAGSLINQLIKKMKKEGHRVHLLTGNRYKIDTYERVFERYDLPYESECLCDVFDSVNPDVTIFMGAFDSNFRWLNEQREIVRFTSSLTNFLTAHSMTSKGRFIYLSSDIVYSDDHEEDISEETETSPSDIKGMALAQGEEVCASFRRIRESDIVTLRLDHLYLIPKEMNDVDDICANMCIDALRDGTITACSENRFSLLYESDAVEFIYQLVKCKEHQHYMYNISSSREITATELAEYIKQAMGEDADITIEENDDENRRCVLANRLFDNEFGVRIFADTQKTVEKVVKYMTDHKNIFLTGEQRKKSLWERISEKTGWFVKAIFPYLENLLCFGLFYLVNIFAAKSEYFSRLDFYLLYVLLFAVVHGQQQATFSAILAVIGYFLSQSGDRSILMVALDYNMYVWIAQLFIVGLVVGYMKDQIRKMKSETEEERQFLYRQLTDIKDINGSNVRVKDALEAQIINQSDSIGKIYSITSTLERYTPEEVLFHAADILREFLGSKDIALYMVSNHDYARLFTFTSDRAKVLGKSIRYREMGEVYDSLSNKKVYINRQLDERYPMMAASIFDENDMRMMIMAWGISWERMTLGHADMLMVVSYLIQNAVLRAARYINMLENRRYQEGQYLMGKEAFTSLMRVFLDARSKHLTECVILKLVIPDELPATPAQPQMILLPKVTAEADTDITPQPEVTVRLKSKRKSGSNRQMVVDLWEENSRGFLYGLKSLWRPRRSGFVLRRAKSAVAHDDPTGMDIGMAGAYISTGGKDNTGEYAKYEEVAKALSGKIRNSDYVGVLEDGNMYVLLCNTNNEEAQFAMNRIRNSGIDCVILEDIEL